MSFKAKAACLHCSDCCDPYTVLYLDVDDLRWGYVTFSCKICGEINTVTLSQCHIIDKEGYEDAVERYNNIVESYNRLKAYNGNQCETLQKKPRKWWKR